MITLQTLNAKINALQDRLGQIVGGGNGAIVKASWGSGNINGFTVNSGGNGALCTSWPIAANDANIGTVYRVRTYGIGTAVASQNFDIFANAFGNVEAETGWDSLPAANYSFMAEIVCCVVTTGASGSAWYSVNGIATKIGVRGDSTTSVSFSGQSSTAQSINTTASTNIFLSGTSSGGGEIAIGQYSTYERIGALCLSVPSPPTQSLTTSSRSWRSATVT